MPLNTSVCMTGEVQRIRSSACCHAMQIVRRIDVAVRSVKWSDNGDLVAILGETSFYVLQHDREVRCWCSLAVERAH